MAKKAETIRFRVPVPTEVATAIERLAARMDRPTAWLAVELLKVAIEDRRRFADWICLGFLGTAYDVIKRVAGRKARAPKPAGEVRLELNAPVELVEQINRVAEQWDQTPVKAAGMLLAAAVHYNEVFIEVVTSRWVKAAMGGAKRGKGAGDPKETPLA